MLINEGGLIRAIKRAYKAGGYTVLNTGNDVAIYTDHWFAMPTAPCCRARCWPPSWNTWA